MASTTVTTIGKVPETVGTPEIDPLVVIDSPPGNPVADHVYGAAPPEATSVVLTWDTPTSPSGIVAGVTENSGSGKPMRAAPAPATVMLLTTIPPTFAALLLDSCSTDVGA